MKIKEVLAKVAKGEALTEEEKKFLAEYNEPDIEKEANARAASARKKAEQDAQELRDKLQEATEALEAAKSGGLSETEKLKKDVERLTKELTKANEAQKKAAEEVARTIRDNQFEKVFSTIKFVDGASTDDARTALKTRLDGVDLSDANAVKAKVDEYVKANVAIIAAGATGGSGSQQGQQRRQNGAGQSQGGLIDRADIKKDPKAARADLDSRWKDAQNKQQQQ